MNFETIHQAEITLMQSLQGIRGPLLDQFMICMNWFDSLAFFMLVILATWYAFDRKVGVRLFFLVMLGVLINQDCKILFGQPRPFELAPELGLITAPSFGFPSGAAQCTLMLFGYLAYVVRKTWFTALAAAFLLLVSYSRIYIGMHFPTDILGGWIIGAAALYLYIRVEPRVEHVILKKSKKIQLGCLLFGTALFHLAGATQSARAMSLVILGCGLGLFIQPLLVAPRCLFQKVLRVLVAYLGFYLLTELPRHSLITIGIGVWISAGAAYVLQKIESLWCKKCD